MIVTTLLHAVVAMLAVITAVAGVNMIAGPFLRRGRNAPPRRAHSTLPSHHDGNIKDDDVHYPSVAICIPARDEERNIGALLSALRAQTVAPRAILVLDDGSRDDTAAIVAAHAQEETRIRLLAGAELPRGWTGKNWACEQLSKEADAEVLIFVDADVLPTRHAVEDTLGSLRNYRADALSSFPRQLLPGLAAAMIIPVMDVILYGFLPLPLVHRTRAASLAAANGQWFAFSREIYTRIGGHAAVRGEIVEDIALARAVKRAQGRMLLTAGIGSVSCRMYNNFREAREGFSKNFFAAFGFKTPAFLAVLLLLLAVFVLPYTLLFTAYWLPASIAVALNILFRALLAWRAGHGILPVLLHPFGVLAAVLIGIDAIRLRYVHGAVRWKDRDIAVGAAEK